MSSQGLLQRIPPATRALCGIMITWFLIMGVLGTNPLSPQNEDLLKYGALFGPLVFEGQSFRLISSLFVHVGLLHLFFNTYILYMIGRDLERLYGPLHFLLIFFFSGLTGTLLSLWHHPIAIVAGASGAIFGLAGAAIAFYIRLPEGHFKEIFKGWRNSLLSFIVLNIVIGLVLPMIDQFGHLGGLLGGFFLGLLIAKPSFKKKTALLPVILVILFIIFSVTSPPHWLPITAKTDYALYQARLALNERKLADAEIYLKRILDREPDQMDANFLLGAVYFDQNKLAQSEEVLERALSKNPAPPYESDTLLLLLHLALQQGHIHTAQERLTAFEKKYPQDPRIADLRALFNEATQNQVKEF